MANRNRTDPVQFYLSDDEQYILTTKFKASGMKIMSTDVYKRQLICNYELTYFRIWVCPEKDMYMVFILIPFLKSNIVVWSNILKYLFRPAGKMCIRDRVKRTMIRNKDFELEDTAFLI